jgi:acyl-coenzyme A thioesterase PaaI-like protein
MYPSGSSNRREHRGRALNVGRRVSFAEAHARNQSGELIGHATTSLAINRP